MKKSENDPIMHVLKSTTCKTLSGRSTLTYQVGCDPDSNIYLRITKNDGGGFFSDEPLAMKDILEVFGKVPKGQPITSFVLQPLFKKLSVNTPAFLVAALANEKLLQLLKGKKRGHIVMDPEDFTARIKKLMSSSEKAKAPMKVPRKKTAKKTTTKRKTTATKKTITRKAPTSK